MISQEIDQLVAALAAFQAEVKAIPKTADNPFFRSKYADLPTVVEAVQPLLTKNGLVVTQMPCLLTSGPDGLSDGLQTILMHTSGQFIEATMLLHLPKLDPQGQGSAITYARRYSYMAVLGLVADVDDDGNAASVNTPKPAPALGAHKRSAPKAPSAPAHGMSTLSAPTPEARVGAAEAKRELMADARDKGWDEVNAKARAKEAWGDRGAESIFQSELLLLLMSIENGPQVEVKN